VNRPIAESREPWAASGKKDVDIREDDEKPDVIIDGIRIQGFIDEQCCADCGGLRIYHMDFDAYFCAECNSWKERACGDLACEFCSNRPERPLPVEPPAAG